MNVTNEIYAKPGLKRMYVISGLSLFTIGLIMFLTLGQGMQLGVSVFLVWIGIWLGRRPLVRFGRDHFEMKLAPLAPLKLIAYRDVKAIAQEGKQLVLGLTDGGSPKNLKIHRRMFTEEDFSMLVGHLKARAGIA